MLLALGAMKVSLLQLQCHTGYCGEALTLTGLHYPHLERGRRASACMWAIQEEVSVASVSCIVQ